MRTHTELKELIRRCSGQFSLTVTKAGTDLLVIGKGEKGEGGKENGKGEDPRSSQRYQDAIRFNESLEKEGKPCIVILSEELLLADVSGGQGVCGAHGDPRAEGALGDPAANGPSAPPARRPSHPIHFDRTARPRLRRAGRQGQLAG